MFYSRPVWTNSSSRYPLLARLRTPAVDLTALAIRQGSYDWGFLAFAVGFGGSMIWFGSSAGVALSALYPQAKSTASWLRHGCQAGLAYVIGFAVMLALLGWQPHVAE